MIPAPVPLAAPSAELPSWFGARQLPARRIAGQLRDGDNQPVAGTVHLRISAPDATVWSGREVTTGSDGRFDFGLLRAGDYSVLAEATHATSRVVPVDTIVGDVNTLPVFVFACRSVAALVANADVVPLPGVAIDTAGVVIATTDASGRFTACANHDWRRFTARTVGYAAATGFIGDWGADHVEMEPAIELRGQLLWKTGEPAAGVAVQPIWPAMVDHGPPTYPQPVHAVTR